MKIALGGSAGGSEALSASALVSENSALKAKFESQFKAGGVAAVSSTAQSDEKSVAVDPIRQARLASTRLAN